MAGKGGGGAWKVAYADFVTAMMAFFLVMWITAQDKSVKEGIARYFQDPFGNSDEFRASSLSGPEGVISTGPHESISGPQRGMSSAPILTSPDPSGKGVASRPQPRALPHEDGRRTGSGTMVVFAEGSVELSDEGRAQLDALIPILVGKPNRIEIRGHASRRPLPPDSPAADEWEASYLRSLATLKYLTDHGVSADRLRLSQSGRNEPHSTDRDPQHQAENARVEIHVLDELVPER